MSNKTTTKTQDMPIYKPAREFSDFTPLQQSVISLYTGNIKQTAALAKVSYGYARELLTKPDIKNAIAIRHQKEFNPKIASRQQRQMFWSTTMADFKIEMRDRLKASELLGKSEADFTENIKTGDIDPEKLDERHKNEARMLALIRIQQTYELPEMKTPLLLETTGENSQSINNLCTNNGIHPELHEASLHKNPVELSE